MCEGRQEDARVDEMVMKPLVAVCRAGCGVGAKCCVACVDEGGKVALRYRRVGQ